MQENINYADLGSSSVLSFPISVNQYIGKIDGNIQKQNFDYIIL